MIEQRVKADPKEDPLLVRLSIGVEEVEVLSSFRISCSSFTHLVVTGSERRPSEGLADCCKGGQKIGEVAKFALLPRVSCSICLYAPIIYPLTFLEEFSLALTFISCLCKSNLP